jgi:hypothetical protein
MRQGKQHRAKQHEQEKNRIDLKREIDKGVEQATHQGNPEKDY